MIARLLRRRIAACERGGTLVEFAIVSPFCMLLLFAIFGFGSALYTYSLVANAAPLGARYAVVHGGACPSSGCTATTSTIQSYVQSKSPGIANSNLAVTATFANTAVCPASLHPAPANNYPGCTVTVAVSYPFKLNLPVLSNLIGWTMSSTSTMVISQ